jgi:signal transduction histidine kinase
MSIGENAFKVHFYADPEWRSYRSYYFPLVIAFLGILLTLLIMRIFFITQKQIAIKQSALNTRDEFLSIASHELKTPITSLQLQLQMIKRKIVIETGLGEARDKIIRSMDNSIYQVSRVTRLIDDLLEISRIENGKQTYYFEKTDISKLITQICESYSDQIAAGGIQFSVKLPESFVIECDSFKIEQVISNLLTNALKYGAGSPIDISLIEETGHARVSIKDGGPGIPEDLQSKVFERFERVTPNKTVSGLGLGLYISKQIVVAHKGTIQVKSKEGVGSEFIVLIPKTQA